MFFCLFWLFLVFVLCFLCVVFVLFVFLGLVGLMAYFLVKVVALRKNREFSDIFGHVPKELEIWEIFGNQIWRIPRGASFGTNLKAAPFLDDTLTLLTNTYMAIGSFL